MCVCVGTRVRSQDNAKRRSLDSTAIVFGTPKGGKLNQERLQSLYGDCIKLATEVRLPTRFSLPLLVLH